MTDTTDARTWLTAAQDRANNATKGPWFAENPNWDEPYSTTTVYNTFHNGDTMDRDLVAEAAYDNAPFIAAARTEHPAMAAVLRAVLDVLDSELSQAEQHLRISRTNHSLGERMLGQHTGASRVIGEVRRAITDHLPKENHE